MTTQISNISQPALRDDWIEACEQLVSQIERWATELNWSSHRSEISIDENETGPYVVPTLRVRMPGRSEIHVTPIARGIPKGNGRVDMESWPSLHRVRFIRRDDNAWDIITDSNIHLREAWNRDAFVNLAQDLTSI